MESNSKHLDSYEGILLQEEENKDLSSSEILTSTEDATSKPLDVSDSIKVFLYCLTALILYWSLGFQVSRSYGFINGRVLSGVCWQPSIVAPLLNLSLSFFGTCLAVTELVRPIELLWFFLLRSLLFIPLSMLLALLIGFLSYRLQGGLGGYQKWLGQLVNQLLTRRGIRYLYDRGIITAIFLLGVLNLPRPFEAIDWRSRIPVDIILFLRGIYHQANTVAGVSVTIGIVVMIFVFDRYWDKVKPIKAQGSRGLFQYVVAITIITQSLWLAGFYLYYSEFVILLSVFLVLGVVIGLCYLLSPWNLSWIGVGWFVINFVVFQILFELGSYFTWVFFLEALTIIWVEGFERIARILSALKVKHKLIDKLESLHILENY